MNTICLLGRLTADPELKHTQNQVPVCSFTLAVDRAYQPKGQERQADFINIVAWRHTAEVVAKHFGKGHRIALTGSLQSRRYTDKDGNNRTAFEVVADTVFFAESKKGDSLPSAAAGAPQNQSSANYSGFAPYNPNADFEEIVGDDDLPLGGNV